MKVYYSMPIDKPNNSSFRKLLPRLYAKHKGKCYYCGRLTKMAESSNLKDYHASVEHLYTRLDMRRLLLHYMDHTVLACHKCNQDRGIEDLNKFKNDYAALPDNIVFDIRELLK